MEDETNANQSNASQASTETTTTETAVAGAKSIIDPKYRLKYKTPDFLAQLLLDNTSKEKTIPANAASAQVGEIGKEGYKPAKEAKPERVVKDGVDIDKLFALASENGLGARIEKFKAQVGGHGFEGRIRMTIRNMLQPVVKQRHGLIVNGTFVSAPDDFLRKIGVLEGQLPTHDKNGVKLAKATVAKDPVVAEGEQLPIEPAPSKLVKKKK